MITYKTFTDVDGDWLDTTLAEMGRQNMKLVHAHSVMGTRQIGPDIDSPTLPTFMARKVPTITWTLIFMGETQ